MNHADHVHLLKKGIPGAGGVWADFGSGDGAFTLALAELLDRSGQIHSVDVDRAVLARQSRAMIRDYPEVDLIAYTADFTRPIDLPRLDGLVVANALHFSAEKEPVVRLLADYLRPGGRFVVVEYDTDRGNRWVPFPFSYDRWPAIAARCGLERTELLAYAPSSFLGRFYSALSYNPPR